MGSRVLWNETLNLTPTSKYSQKEPQAIVLDVLCPKKPKAVLEVLQKYSK